MADKSSVPSISRVNRAGQLLRRTMARRMPIDTSFEDIERAFDVLWAFRDAHRYPLVKATMGLRSMVQTEGCPIVVTQRMKRVPSMMLKLERQPSMALSKMQDIAGCRAVLRDLDEVERVRRRLAKNRPPIRVSDYVAKPRSSGYRAAHLVVVYDERAIEVQLRTVAMQEWAITMEKLGGRLHTDLKGGIGPRELLDLMNVISEAMALEEAGARVDTDLLARIAALRERAAPYLTGGSST